VEGLSLDRQGGISQVGRWQFLRELGRGGSGIVYLAWDPLLRREVAVKVPRPEVLLTPELRQRFLREAQAAAGFEHPNLVPVYEAGEVGPFCYIVSAYCRGTTLGTWLKQQAGFVAPRIAATLVAAVTDAVAYIHRRGVLHRDIKPNNILLQTEFTAEDTDEHRGREPAASPLRSSVSSALNALVPKLTDFGLAKQTRESGEETRSGTLLGTPLYMAPEQAEGRVRDIGSHTDLYALGVLLYELLTGRPPFLGDTLRRFLQGRPIQARQVGSGEKLWRWCRRNPAVASLMTAVAILLLAGTGISAYFAVKSANFAVQAIQEKGRADQRAEDLRKQLSISNVNRALGEWQKNNISLTERLLDACPEDLRDWEWRYARRLCYQDRVAIYGFFAPGGPWYGNIAHQTVAFSPDSQWVAAMDWDHTLKLWDTATGTRIRALEGETGLVLSLAFSPDGQWLASGNSDHTVRIWNTETGQLVHTLREHRFLVYHVHFPRDGKRIISAGPVLVDNHEWLTQMEIITWDVATGRPLSRKVVADANIIWGAVAFSPDGSQFIAAGNSECRDLGPRIAGYLGSALGQGPFLAAATLRPGGPDDATMKLGNTDTGQCVHTLYSEWVWTCAFRPDGKVVATSGGERIWLWDTATGRGIRSLQGHTGEVRSLAFGPDGTRLASGSSDNTVRLWDTTTGKELACFRGHRSFVQSVAFSPDGQWIASAGGEGVVRLWDVLHSGEPVTLRGRGGEYPSDLSFSPDGQHLYYFSGFSHGGTPEGIKGWDWRSAKQVLAFPGSAGWLTGMAMSPDGKCIASADKNGNITLWDASSGRRLHRWAARTGPIHSLAYSPDGKALAYTSGDQVTVIDAETRRELNSFQGSGSALYSLAFSADNARIAAAAQDQVLVWDWATGQILFSFAANTYDDRMAAFGRILALSSDGKLAAADKNRISIRDALTGREILNLPGHSGRIVCLAFSPDGRRLASGSSADYDVKLWDTTTGAEMLALRCEPSEPLCLAFSPDGDRLASSSNDGDVKIWDATLVSPNRIDQRVAHEWVNANFSHTSGVEDNQVLEPPKAMREPARTFALQMARRRAEQIGRIPAYYSRLGNELWPKGWTGFAHRAFTLAENGFRKSLALNPGKASAHGDFAFFLMTCPDPQFRDAAKALTHAQKAAALEPGNADYAALWGMAQYRSGEWQVAVDTLEKAIARAPARFSGHARIFLAMAHQQLGHATEAQLWYEQALTERIEECSNEALSQLRAEAATVLGIRATSTSAPGGL
jgi:WD40 repeat protein/serine/threonine protein kinase